VMDTESSRSTKPAEVTLTVPAQSRYLSVVRTAAAGLAARLDFTLDDIEDLRIAVDEACALLLKQARSDSEVRCEFRVVDFELGVRASAVCDRPFVPSRDGFSWTVLSALTSSVDINVHDHELVIDLTRTRGGVEQG
jgi:serine/threonine-protein kinase RsbW